MDSGKITSEHNGFRNLTLATMHRDDLAELLPDLSERVAHRGELLVQQGSLVKTVSFVSTATVANTVTYRDGRTVETFAMGIEGVTGLAPFLANSRCAWTVEVRTAGIVHEIPASTLRRRVEASPRLHHQLMLLASEYQAQASIGVGCAVSHDNRARLARALLKIADLNRSEVLRLTHEELALRLGVQRTTVTESANEIRQTGAISYSRGVIEIKNRPALRAEACECYELERQLGILSNTGINDR